MIDLQEKFDGTTPKKRPAFDVSAVSAAAALAKVDKEEKSPKDEGSSSRGRRRSCCFHGGGQLRKKYMGLVKTRTSAISLKHLTRRLDEEACSEDEGPCSGGNS